MSRRRGRRALTVSVPVSGALYCWRVSGEPGHLDGLLLAAAGAAALWLVLARLAALVLPGCIPALVPRAWRIRYRRGRPRPAIPARIRRAVMAADRGACVYCRSRAGLQIDHIRPWAAGGLTAVWNLAVLCALHNRVKSNYSRDPDGYVHYRPFGGHGDIAAAAGILRAELRCRRSPLRWLRIITAA